MSKLKKGFTIVELSIVISFLAVLLIFITNTITGISATYRRGLSMKKINSVGRDLIDEFTSAVNNSIAVNPKVICTEYYNNDDKPLLKDPESYNRCIEDGAYLFTYQQHTYKSIVSYNKTIANAPGFGMFCTGTYSYLWNTGYILDEETYLDNESKSDVPGAQLSYKNKEGEDVTLNTFRILRLEDINRSLCASQIAGGYPVNPETNQVIDQIPIEDTTGNVVNIDFTAPESGANPVELIATSEMGGLAFYDMMIYPPSVDTLSGSKLYVGSFILGTLNSGVVINPLGESCVAPPGGSYSSDYCALNKFNFTIRSIGGNI